MKTRSILISDPSLSQGKDHAFEYATVKGFAMTLKKTDWEYLKKEFHFHLGNKFHNEKAPVMVREKNSTFIEIYYATKKQMYSRTIAALQILSQRNNNTPISIYHE